MYAGFRNKDRTGVRNKQSNMCLSTPALQPDGFADPSMNPASDRPIDRLMQQNQLASARDRAITDFNHLKSVSNGEEPVELTKSANTLREQAKRSNQSGQAAKGNWIKTQNMQNLLEFNNLNGNPIAEGRAPTNAAAPRAVPKTTQNKTQRQRGGVEQIEQYNKGHSGQILKTQQHDQDAARTGVSQWPPDQDMSFQDFNYIDGDERGIDTLSASEPYSTIVNQKSKQQMPLNSAKKRKLRDHSSNLQQKKDFHDNLSLMNEQQKLVKQQKDFLKVCKSDYIPCIYFQGNSDKVLIHFHANGEDIGQTQPLMRKINQKLRINILCMEYPGYGLYEEADGLTKKQQRSKQIQNDAETVFKFVRDRCNVDENNIIIMGRSIGSGPACHLASKFLNARCLILISPIKSVKEVARQNYGRIVDLLIEERFDNFEVAKKIKCPVLVYHGLKDTMVPYQHSIEMLIQGFIQSEAHMFLRQDMEHNKFDYINDIIRPMKYFFRVNRIITTKKKRTLGDADVEDLRKEGYVDKKALRFYQHLGIASKSHYFNNFSLAFKPQMPKKSSKGVYLQEDYSWPQRERDHNVQELDEDKVLAPILAASDHHEDLDVASPLQFQKQSQMQPNDRMGPGAPSGLQQDQPPLSLQQC